MNIFCFFNFYYHEIKMGKSAGINKQELAFVIILKSVYPSTHSGFLYNSNENIYSISYKSHKYKKNEFTQFNIYPI